MRWLREAHRLFTTLGARGHVEWAEPARGVQRMNLLGRDRSRRRQPMCHEHSKVISTPRGSADT